MVKTRSTQLFEECKVRTTSELSEKIGQLKMLASDGKMRMTDVDVTNIRFSKVTSDELKSLRVSCYPYLIP